MSKSYCSASVYRNGYYTGSGCANLAKVERDGKGYCNLHDPEKVKARRDAQDQARRESADAQLAQRQHWNAANAERRDAALARLAALRAAQGRPAVTPVFPPYEKQIRPLDGVTLATEQHPRFGLSYTGGLTLDASAVDALTEHIRVLHGTVVSLAERG